MVPGQTRRARRDARANLAAHDLETGREAYHLDSIYYATAEQMEAICPTGIDFDRYATLANGSVGYDEADAHWDDAAWWDERARTMWDEATTSPTTASTGQVSRAKRHRRSRPSDAPGPMPPA